MKSMKTMAEQYKHKATIERSNHFSSVELGHHQIMGHNNAQINGRKWPEVAQRLPTCNCDGACPLVGRGSRRGGKVAGAQHQWLALEGSNTMDRVGCDELVGDATRRLIGPVRATQAREHAHGAISSDRTRRSKHATTAVGHFWPELIGARHER